ISLTKRVICANLGIGKRTRRVAKSCFPSEAHVQTRAFVFFARIFMYVVYLDEFGHIGPFVSRNDAKYHESPIFGMAGVILPVGEVRSFATWFFQRKCQLLEFEIN